MADIVPQDIFDRLPERYRRRAREISARVAEIDRLLIRCETPAIRDAAIRLRGQLRPQPDMDVSRFAEEFRLACADLPEWAVSEATNDFLAGRVENHTGQFMPSCAEFARHARAIVRPFAAERAGLRHEAEKLLERASDDRRRELIAIERADPSCRERVRQLIDEAKAGAAVQSTARPHIASSVEERKRIEALRPSRPEPKTRLLETRIVRGKYR